MSQISNIAKTINTIDKNRVRYVEMPNLLKSTQESLQSPYQQEIIIAVCEDCKAILPTEKTSQFCRCGAMVFPF